jgi:predicted outer membrane protein
MLAAGVMVVVGWTTAHDSGSVIHDSQLSRAPQGPAPQGPAPQGPAPQGPAPQGPAPQGPVAGSPAVVGASTLPAGWTMTTWGPLGPADRDFLVRIRQAGLWETPMGELAQERAGTEVVKGVGRQLAADHRGLDDQVRAVAGRLSVTLPDQANADQQGWMAELRGKWNGDFDVAFANRLRAAHGKVFAVISVVRAGTRNTLIRAFAQAAVDVVMKHMTLLETTNNVDFAALPTAPAPAQAGAAGASNGGGSRLPLAFWVFLGIVVALGVASIVWFYVAAR